MSVGVSEAVTWTERSRGRCERKKYEGKRKKRGRKERKTRVRTEGGRRKRMKAR